MPIVIVHSLKPTDSSAVDRMLSAVAHDLAEAIRCGVSDVWVYWEEVQAMSVGMRRVPFEGHCPVATVLAREGRNREAISRGLEAIASALATALGVPREDVWVHWLDVPAGRIFAGGGLM